MFVLASCCVTSLIFIESTWRKLAWKVALKFLEYPVSEKSRGTAVYVMASVHRSLSPDASGQSH